MFLFCCCVSLSPLCFSRRSFTLCFSLARAIAAIARDRQHWKLAGDQFFVDLDLSPANLPPGTRLQIGTALIEVTAEPHLGCKKFQSRFGRDAVKFVNSAAGKALNLRGINAKIIQAGMVKPGDSIKKC